MAVLLTLAVAALLTSMLSGILGMGGGMLLLALLFSLLGPFEAVALHAVVQIFSNGTRTIAFFRDHDRQAYWHFLLGAIPGGLLGWAAMAWLVQVEGHEPYLKIVIGIYILAAALLAKPAVDRQSVNLREFTVIGGIAGFAALPFGAVGPLIAPTFARQGYSKERLIGTKALCQTTLHLVKVPALLTLVRIEPDRLGLAAIVMIAMVIPGTLIGKWLLQYVNERQFRSAYRVALLVSGFKILIIDGIYALWGE